MASNSTVLRSSFSLSGGVMVLILTAANLKSDFYFSTSRTETNHIALILASSSRCICKMAGYPQAYWAPVQSLAPLSLSLPLQNVMVMPKPLRPQQRGGAFPNKILPSRVSSSNDYQSLIKHEEIIMQRYLRWTLSRIIFLFPEV